MAFTRIKPDWFMLGMVVAVALAWIFPGPGADGGWMHPELLTKIGVALVFFLHGLAISFEAMRAGMLRWKLHLVVQGCTFLFFPIIGLIVLWCGKGWIPEDAGMGFFYLCALPSTVSSSVAMTAAARGNVAAAVFNATLSSLIGIVLTPIWVSLVMEHSADGQGMEYGKVMLDLVQWLLVPLIAGQLLRPVFGAWAARNKKTIHIVDRGTILLLVYTSFCDSMQWGVWSGHGYGLLLGTALAALVLFAVVLATTNFTARLLGFSEEDRITAVFCGSKKSLAQGIPMARLIFGSNPALGIILLPILIYHPLQLFICGILASRWARRPVVA